MAMCHLLRAPASHGYSMEHIGPSASGSWRGPSLGPWRDPSGWYLNKNRMT